MLNNKYLFNENFLELAKKNYDAVIIDWEIQNHTIQSILMYHTANAKNILVILKDSSLESILPITTYSKANITIINPSTWILWFANKWFWDKRDIAKAMSFGFEVFEPYTQEDISNYLNNKSSKKYIRTSENTVFAEHLPEADYVDENNLLISLQKYWFQWSNWTIITLGMNTVASIHAGTTLQEKWKSMDIFVSKTANISFCKTLQESIQRTEKLIIIIDQHPGSMYESFIKAKLFDIWLYETEIFFITPNYQLITTTIAEYIAEQAKFDWINIAKKIIDL